MGRYRLPGGPSPAEHDRLVVGPVPRSPDDEDDAAAAMREMRLAAWVRTSLLGILLGLGLAKYAQARVGDALHTAALVGTVVVAASAALTAVAAHRYLVWGTRSPRRYPAARPLVSLSLFVVVVLAWLALAPIWAAGPDALPAQAP